MDLEYGPQYDDFRAEVINFIKENENTKLSGPPRSESRVEWQQKLIDNGYFARSIPKEYGGYGGDMDIELLQKTLQSPPSRSLLEAKASKCLFQLCFL